MAGDTGDGRQERVLVPVGSSKNPKLRWQAQAARTLSEVCAASLLSSTELVAVLQHTTGQSILPGELDQWQEGRVEFPAWIIPAITDVAGLYQEDGHWVMRGQPRERSWLVAALSAPFRVLWRGRGVVAAGLLGTFLYAGHHYLGPGLRLPALPMSHGNPAAHAPRGNAPARVQNDTTTARMPDSQSGAAALQPTAAPTAPPPAPAPPSAPVQSVAAAPAGSATSTRGASRTAATAPQQAVPAQATTETNAAPAHSTPRATPPPPAPAPASGSPGGLLGLLGGLLGLLGL